MLGLMLAVALTAPPATTSPEIIEEARDWLIVEYQHVDDRIVRVQDAIGQTKNPEPTLGLHVDVVKKEGAPPQYAILINFVVPTSVADRAGIKAGDRIAAIGKEELDVLSGKGVLLLLSDYPDMVPLVIERDGIRLSFSLKRQVVPCIAAAMKLIDRKAPLDQISKLLEIERAQAGALRTMTTLEGLEEAAKNLDAIDETATLVLRNVEKDLGGAMYVACNGRK